MQKVSQKWKDNHEQTLVGESFIDITMTLLDPDAYEDATATDNGAITISNTAQTVSEVEKNIVPYATLERNMWLLNGGRKIVPVSNYGDCGFISKTFAEMNAIFPTPPVLTMSFSGVQYNLIQGVTIEWGTAYDEYASDFTVTAYNGDTVIGTKEVTGNTDIKSVVYMDIVEYDRITITVIKWCLPYRRARISNILPGIEVSYSKKDLFSFSHKQSVDPISAELPKSETSFSIDNSSDTFNPNNTSGLSKYLMEQQEIKVKYGFKIEDSIEWIKCGTFYMSEWDAQQNGMTAEFTARGILEFMTNTYYKGLYNPNGISLYDLAVDVLTDANLPLLSNGSVRWVVDESLKDIYTVAPLPVDTHANCLQLIANAGGCVIHPGRDGMLYVKRLAHSTTLTNMLPTPSQWSLSNVNIVSLEGYGETFQFLPNVTSMAMCSIPAPVVGHKYYGRCTYMVEAGAFSCADGRFEYYYSDKTNGLMVFQRATNKNSDGKAKVESSILSIPQDISGGATQWKFRNFVVNGTQKVYRANPLLIDLTATFGEGNEPTKDWCDANIPNFIGTHTMVYSTYSINSFNSYSKPEIALSKPLKQVDVKYYSYNSATTSTELYKGSIAINGTKDVWITYSGTATSVSASVSGGTLNSATYYANACVLNITSNGEVTITVTGKSIESSSVIVTTDSGVNGEIISVDNSLITNQANALMVGAIVEDYMKNRKSISTSWRADPRLDALDIVVHEGEYDTNHVIMTNVDFSYNGAFHGTGEGRVI